MIRRMKKWIACVGLFLLFAVQVAAAGGTEYELAEMGLRVTIPDGYIVMTRESLASLAETEDESSDSSRLLAAFEEDEVYLLAISPEQDWSLRIGMREGFLPDYAQRSDAELASFALSAMSNLNERQEDGIFTTGAEVYRHAQAKFVKWCASGESAVAAPDRVMYYTEYGGKAVTLRLETTEPMSEAQLEELEAIVDSIEFDDIAALPEDEKGGQEAGENAPVFYTGPGSGVRFALAGNWQKESGQAHDGWDSMVFSLPEDGVAITYSYVDLWAHIPETERKGYRRVDLDSRTASKDTMAAIMGVAASQIKKQVYGGTEYYTTTMVQSLEEQGVAFELDCQFALVVRDGYAHIFMLAGRDGYQADFEAMLSSLKFPEPLEATSLGESVVYHLIRALILTVTLYTMPIVVYRYGIRRAPLDRKKARMVSIIYGIVMLVVDVILVIAAGGSKVSTGAVILWSCVNYRILIAGAPKAAEQPRNAGMHQDVAMPQDAVSTVAQVAAYAAPAKPSQKPQEPKEPPVRAGAKYCYMCGSKLPKGSTRCDECGAEQRD